MNARACIRGSMRRVWFTPRIILCWFPPSRPDAGNYASKSSTSEDLNRKLARPAFDDGEGANGTGRGSIRRNNQIDDIRIEGAFEVAGRGRVLGIGMGMVDPEMFQRFRTHTAEEGK